MNKFKIIISNGSLYKEAVLDGNLTRVNVGTETDCDIRFRRDYFFKSVSLTFSNTGEGWNLRAGEGMYLLGSGRCSGRHDSLDLMHGDSLEVRYLDSDGLVFTIEYAIDFDDVSYHFNRYADVSGLNSIYVGSGKNFHISLHGPYIGNDSMELVRNGRDFIIRILDTSYGIMHNGKKVVDGEVFRNGDFFAVADNFFYLKNNQLWTDKDSQTTFHGLQVYDTVDRGTYPFFRRNSRIRSVVNEEKIQVLDPAQKPQKPKNNLLLRLLPSVGMVLAAAVMAAIGGSLMIIFSLVSVATAAVTAVLTVKNNNKEYRENLEERTSTYNEYIAAKRQEIEQCRADERQTLETIYISPETERNNVHQFSPALFDRSRDDEDFLCVRLGTGVLPSHREIDYKVQERLEPGDELQQIPENLKKEYEYISDVPVTVDLKEINALGIAGTEKGRYDLMKNMVIDLATRQFNSDVTLVFVARPMHSEVVRRFRFLPNVQNEYLGVRNIVLNDESKTIIFEYLYKELTMREQTGGYEKRIVVFLYDEYGFRSHPVSQFLGRAKELGITFIFFGDHDSDIPAGCDKLIYLTEPGAGWIVNAYDSKEQYMFRFTPFSTAQVDRMVALLAPVKVEEISLEGDLTKNITLFSLLNILSVEDLDLGSRWASTNVTKSMAAPLGVTKTGTISLDLHDKAHGPHGLVAGTTGSGKSEILQTYILSMATLFHPYEVGFMIIDFKGGGMAGQFAELPHLMGTITNIDGREIERSLKSIKAELQKRQRLFAEADVNHIDKYIQKFKAGEVSQPLPHLIIIVDEFAELKAEQPEFMKELISAARIGRSLGVHLILATQKPAGQVNEQIWSNSRFKLCLKVQSKEDSNEVIKSPLAAEIREPGRAYLQVGNNEIFELLQSAYSGAPEKADDSSVKEFSIIELTDTGRRVPVYVQKKKANAASLTQLDSIVGYVSKYCREQGIEKLPEICLPSLGEVIPFPEKTDEPLSGTVVAWLGIYDDPDNQVQGVYSVDITSQNTMIIGSSQSGKTNILQTIVRSLATDYSPDEVTIYIIDFASMILKNFESLNHVGGVVTSQEDEKLKNLFKLLFGEMEKRKNRLLEAGVSSFAAYKEAGMKDLPQIVVLIDNLTALKELYFQDDDDLLRLCREGLTLGISVVIANSTTTGIGYRYLSNFAGRIALFCNDSGEYSSLFDHCRIQPLDIHGRGIIEMDKALLEAQMFLAFEGEKEFERIEAIHSFIEEKNAAYGGSHANIIPEIPDVLQADLVGSYYLDIMDRPGKLVIGLDYDSVSPVTADLTMLGLIGISGRPGMGQKNFIKYIVSMHEQMYPGNIQVHIVDGMTRRLKELATLPQVVSYDSMAEKACDVITDAAAELQQRYETAAAGLTTALDAFTFKLLIFNDPECMQYISNNSAALEAFRNITGRLRNMKVCMIFSSMENVAVPYSAPEVTKKLKENAQFVIFDDLANLKIFDAPMATLRKYKKPVSQGDAYFVKGNDYIKLKTPLL